MLCKVLCKQSAYFICHTFSYSMEAFLPGTASPATGTAFSVQARWHLLHTPSANFSRHFSAHWLLHFFFVLSPLVQVLHFAGYLLKRKCKKPTRNNTKDKYAQWQPAVTTTTAATENVALLTKNICFLSRCLRCLCSCWILSLCHTLYFLLIKGIWALCWNIIKEKSVISLLPYRLIGLAYIIYTTQISLDCRVSSSRPNHFSIVLVFSYWGALFWLIPSPDICISWVKFGHVGDTEGRLRKAKGRQLGNWKTGKIG